MTTFLPFTPLTNANFAFQATFDDASYALTVTWNYYGQRWYITCTTIQGDAIYTIPLTASPPTFDIDLNLGYFATPMVFRDLSQTFEIG